jgi:hypothetical protein
MIYIGLNIYNPLWKYRFKNFWHRCWYVSKNKNLEIEIYKHSNLVGFSLSLAPFRDHAGFDFCLDLLGYSFSFNFYDTRHWEDIK